MRLSVPSDLPFSSQCRSSPRHLFETTRVLRGPAGARYYIAQPDSYYYTLSKGSVLLRSRFYKTKQRQMRIYYNTHLRNKWRKGLESTKHAWTRLKDDSKTTRRRTFVVLAMPSIRYPSSRWQNVHL